MAKHKRQGKREPGGTSAQPVPALSELSVPSAATLFRVHLLGSAAQDMLAEALAEIHPQTLARDQQNIDRIKQAGTVEEVLDLAAIATGLAERAWHHRVRTFGLSVAPLIAERLNQARDVPDSDAQSTIGERLLGVLGSCGDAGIEATLACFDALKDYGKSLACVVLGHLGARDSADRLWDFYQSVKQETHENLFIGPLWGLVDLEDPRAADALDELLWSERFFYEALAVAYKAGDARSVLPLMYLFHQGEGPLRDSAVWALTGVAHRIGREALLAEVQQIGAETDITPAQHEKFTDHLLALPQHGADKYFAVFYEGIDPGALDLEEMRAGMSALGGKAASGRKPGRNDPCWCGSGLKYKHCHWQQDQRQKA